MTGEYTIEWCNLGIEDWSPLSKERVDYLNKTHMRDLTVGNIIRLMGASGVEFEFRKVPLDPLLKAIVLARVEGKSETQSEV